MKRLIIASLLSLTACNNSALTPPSDPAPVVVETPAPKPAPVNPEPENPFKNFEKLGNVPGLCEVFLRKDDKINTRFWLYTKDCNGYVLVKWFENLTDERSTTYIGLVGNGEEAYLDILTNSNKLTGYIQGTDPSAIELEHYFDVGRTYYPLYKVQLIRKTY